MSKVPNTVSFLVNDLRLWGLRLKSWEDITFEISELGMKTIRKVGRMFDALEESLHTRRS